MDFDLLSDILNGPPPDLGEDLLQNLPHCPLTRDFEGAANELPENSNQAGAVISKIEDIFHSIADSILHQKQELVIHMRSRQKVGNQNIGTQNGAVKRLYKVRFPSKSPQEAWKFAVLLRILELSHEALATGIIATKRDIYYRDRELFMKQAVVDRYVEDLAYTLEVERDALNIVAAAKGLVAGSLIVKRKDNSEIDYSSEREGILVPLVKGIQSFQLKDARWILVIEKEATFRTLANIQYWNTSLAGKGIIITAKGYPDIQTRQFLHLLSTGCTGIPIFCLVDFDPDGIGIMSTYRHGSINLSHQNQNLTVPSIRWLGLRSADIFFCEGSGKVGLLRLSTRDRRIATRMLERNVFQEGRGEWRKELQIMLMMNFKAEIQILNDGSSGLETWLDMKLVDEA
ncbi:hypothetical protein OIDMADRAFT_160910 [Oidiodendron maius Zn]|uniref:DNA topoisomerase (ATP-hydrolyzing) n=1 Tax=Oidiodendron maius (strain Zn) TaxID=913774 RepID=A0A0C3DI00_OIDMZ|nr:hypothetical protein OIDMADRAFT_160910 [Oidiodendron maius Zn]